MVIGEKHYKHTDEGPVKIVRRNRSPPNASRGTAEDGAGPSTNDNDDCVVREGPEYQATIPQYNPSNQSLKELPDSNYAVRMWAPTPRSMDIKVNLYVDFARENYKYGEEQALGLLYWHGYNVDQALADLPNFAPTPNNWTVEDLVLFEQAFHFHGKNFQKIHELLPDKNIGDLVTYYYLWKKIQYRVSLLDKRAKSAGQCGNGSEKDVIDDSDSDFESIREPLKEDASVEPVRVVSRSKVEVHNRFRNKHKPPPGIYISHDDLKVLANSPHNMAADVLQKPLELELDSLKRRVIASKQEIAALRQRTSIGIDLFRPTENQTPVNSKWTHDELLLAVQGVRRYGKNFAAIAELLGNKTEHLVQNFFYSFQVQYNLDAVLQEYEAEHGRKETENVEDGPTDMEVDGPGSDMANAPTSSSPPPPPLMKQFSGGSSRHGSHHPTEIVHKPPVLHQAIKNTSLSGRMILHQPPPLFKHGPSLSSSSAVVSAAK